MKTASLAAAPAEKHPIVQLAADAAIAVAEANSTRSKELLSTLEKRLLAVKSDELVQAVTGLCALALYLQTKESTRSASGVLLDLASTAIPALKKLGKTGLGVVKDFEKVKHAMARFTGESLSLVVQAPAPPKRGEVRNGPAARFSLAVTPSGSVRGK